MGVGTCICKEVTLTYFPMLWGLSSAAAGFPSILFAVQQSQGQGCLVGDCSW